MREMHPSLFWQSACSSAPPRSFLQFPRRGMRVASQGSGRLFLGAAPPHCRPLATIPRPLAFFRHRQVTFRAAGVTAREHRLEIEAAKRRSESVRRKRRKASRSSKKLLGSETAHMRPRLLHTCLEAGPGASDPLKRPSLPRFLPPLPFRRASRKPTPVAKLLHRLVQLDSIKASAACTPSPPHPRTHPANSRTVGSCTLHAPLYATITHHWRFVTSSNRTTPATS